MKQNERLLKQSSKKTIQNDEAKKTKSIISIKQLCFGAFLSIISVLLHSAPAFLPSIGMILSPFATLPIAFAAILQMPLGIVTYITASIMLLFIDLQEAVIFIFTTGLLGVTIGVFQLERTTTIIISSFTLFFGIHILTYLIAIPGFIQVSNTFSFPVFTLLITGFSTIYSYVWFFGMKTFIKELQKRKLYHWFMSSK